MTLKIEDVKKGAKVSIKEGKDLASIGIRWRGERVATLTGEHDRDRVYIRFEGNGLNYWIYREWLELIKEEPKKGDLYRVKRDAELREVYLGPERYLLGKTVTFTGEYIETEKGRLPYFDCPRKSGDGTEQFFFKWDMVEKVDKEKEMSELEEYKKKVYEVAKRVKEDNDWCDPGYREVLKELGLTDPAVATLDSLPDGAVLSCGGGDIVVKSGKKWIYHALGAEPETFESTENLVAECDGSGWLIVATNESIEW